VGSTVDTGRHGAWLTLHAAADRLGISEKTARRRVKAGELEGRQVPTQHGPTWQVWVDSRVDGVAALSTVDVQGTLPDQGRQGTHGDQGPEVLELVRLVNRLHDENRVLTEAATVWQARADILAHQLDQARGEMRALQAPAPQDAHPWPQDGHRATYAPEPTTGSSDPKPQPSPVSAPIPPKPNGSSWWGRVVAWLTA